MNWWILYEKEDYLKNIEYVNLYFKECEKYGISLTLVLKEELGLVIKNSETEFYVKGEKCTKPALVINRSRDYVLAKHFEMAGIKVWNDSFVTLIGNDKALAYSYAVQKGIPVLDSYYGNVEPEKYPYVLKSLNGHGGGEVFLIQTPDEKRKIEYSQEKQEIESSKDKESKEEKIQWQESNDFHQMDFFRKNNFLCQEFASEPGKDVRVYVIGNRIVKAMLRTNENDFKSNYSLGGKVAEYELNPEEEALVNKVIGGLNIGLAGIDFVFHQGMLYFNEIEDVVGARMLYANTDIDIVAEYVSYLVKNSVKIVKI
ncbi:MAG: hypothetical protein II321_00680 [Lachnospiraceae bacterium]|nr:hypothetical protein [Lachnospiraceae bacterium]